ncbi:MAG: hypothetical protein LBR43_01845 [Spiroplasmataceae bacterium]|jgi:hypothetical protein|nr:hypothetical protein [Spiroplasmataceae bacterium]
METASSTVINANENENNNQELLHLNTQNNTLRVLYQYENYSGNNFPSRFENEEIERTCYVYTLREKIEDINDRIENLIDLIEIQTNNI